MRSDVSFQAFETLWHVAQAAQADSSLAGDERERLLGEIVGGALDQLRQTIQQGFDDLKRLETLADYAGLRSEPRFKELVAELAAKTR